MKNEIKQTWHFNQPPKEVWDYLTRPELIEQWLMKSDFRPIVGHKFCFTHVPKNNSIYMGITHCEVLEVKPFSKLSYSWQVNTQDGSRSFDSKVVWTLIPEKNGTTLQLQHDGFGLMEDMLAHDKGWNTCLNRMIDLIKSSSHANTNT